MKITIKSEGVKQIRMKRFWTGVLAILPSIIMLCSIILALYIYTLPSSVRNETLPDSYFNLIISLVVIELISVFAVLAQIVIYIITIFKNTTFNSNKKALWIILIYFLNIFTIPIFWFLYVGRREDNRSNLT